jgi:peroxiredoxin/outer membrane lipoprotein-sorting protein
MLPSILVRLCALLAILCGLAQADNLSAEAICGKVSETYRHLRMCEFAAQFTTEYTFRGNSLGGETYFALAMAKPDKVRLTKKDRDKELIVVSNGETTFRYLPRTKEYTKESVATLEDEEQSQQPSRGDVDPLTDAQNKLVNRYASLIRYAPVTVLAKEDRLKVDRDKVDCYVETAKMEQNRLPVAVKATLTFKQADIAAVPENDLFAFTPHEKSVEVQTLNLPGERPNVTGTMAQDFTLNTLDGAKIRLSDLRGKVVLLDFWATWCPPCRIELPNIEKLHQEYKEKGLVVLGIDDEDGGTVKGFLKNHKYSLPVLMDVKRAVHRMYGARAIPTVVVIDPDGVIKAYYVGERSEKDLLAAVKTAGLQ